MGSLFRSEEMTLCQLFLQQESAYTCVSELGELGLVQFRDLNPEVNAFQRKFVNEVRRCDEMERKLRFLEKEINRDGIPMLDTGDNPDAPAPREMIDLEAAFEKLENEMKEVNANSEALKRNYLELTELKHILRKTQHFFDEAEMQIYQEAASSAAGTTETERLLGDEPAAKTHVHLGFVAGVIHRERIPAFERMLWRVCRGNVFLKQAEIDTPLEDPSTGDQVNKSVFIIFFQGEQLKSRVKKICEGFRATLYPCPESPAERREMAMGVMTRLEDLNTVLGQTQDHRHRVLVAAAKNVKLWFVKVKKLKAIYHTMNMCSDDVTAKCLIAECWCPVADLDKIQLALRRGTEKSGGSIPSILNRMHSKEEPPTYNRTNKFTSGFQNIVDAYGVGNYREVNPAPYTIITFPFLFAVMFGDCGHGTCMFLCALFLVIKEKQFMAHKSDNEIFMTFFNGRYIILLMGMFSIYTGLLYNDCFSKSFVIFSSSWEPKMTYKEMFASSYVTLNPNTSQYVGFPYPLGMDPVWNFAENAITFTDSFKMKLSVILGVTQMVFGISLSLVNNIYFKRPMNIYCEFIPQMIFINSIFGYLIILIFYKWIAYTPALSNTAPSLLIGLIDMFLFKYTDSGSEAFFYKMETFQTILVVICGICVPWMLCLKPFLIWRGRKQKRMLQAVGGHVSINSGDISTPNNPDVIPSAAKESHEEEEDMVEIIVHSAIHTIEFCLGCISNTASYLRLWALSLAHSQLSEVLWEMVLRNGLKIDSYLGAVALVPVFAAWAVLTVAILLLMEGLSAFLHALRLHWVEFQNKYYTGAGYKFMPFSFQKILDGDID